MPRVLSSQQKWELLFQSLIDCNMRLYGYKSKRQLAGKLGVTEKTFYKKYNSPEKFTLEELRKIACLLHFTNEDKGKMIS